MELCSGRSAQAAQGREEDGDAVPIEPEANDGANDATPSQRASVEEQVGSDNEEGAAAPAQTRAEEDGGVQRHED